MPEPTPAPVTPPSPNPTPATPLETGSASLASDLMADLISPKPAATSPAPAATPAAPAEPPKPAATAPEPPKPAATPPKPAAAPPPPPKPVLAAPKTIDPDDAKLTAPELRKHLKQVIADSQRTVAEKEVLVGQLNSKLRVLEGKRYLTEDDEKQQQATLQRIAKLEADLYGRDYSASPDFKKNFTDKIDAQAKEALDVFKSLSVTYNEGEVEKTREGKWDDVVRILGAPNNAERRKMAKELFGPDFQEALDVINPMVQTQKAADQAIKEKTENYQSEAKTQAEKFTAQQRQVQGFIKGQTDVLAQKFPDIFAAAETDTEAAANLKKGFDFVDECTSKANMDINERAARASLVRAWAGAFPRLVGDIARLRAENAALKEENAKYRGSDPGGAGDGGGGGTPPKDDGGSDSMAAEMDNLK